MYKPLSCFLPRAEEKECGNIHPSPEYFSLFTSSGTKPFLPYPVMSQEQLTLFLTGEREGKIGKVSMLTSYKKDHNHTAMAKNHRMQFF